MNHKDNEYDDRHWAEPLQDDLGALSRLVSLPALGYQDIGQQQQRDAILERWPLLDELSMTPDADDPCQ